MDADSLIAGLGFIGAGLVVLVVGMVLTRGTGSVAHPSRRRVRVVGCVLLGVGIVLIAYFYIGAALMAPVTPV